MAARDFDLPPPLEALVVAVCRARGVPEREHDAIRALVSSPEGQWPACCLGSCSPCVDDQKAYAREVMARWLGMGRPVT